MKISISKAPDDPKIRVDIRLAGEGGMLGDAKAFVMPEQTWLEVPYAVLDAHKGETVELESLQAEAKG